MMSGLEVPSLVFGVLPILIEAVKAYSTVASSLHTFRHYSKEVRIVQVQFRCCHGIFKNECRLLLCLVADEKGAEDMLDDTTDRRWTSKDFNDQLNEALKGNFDLCRSIVEASKEVVDEMIEALEKFGALVKTRSKNESIKAFIKPVRDAVRITFNKSKYEKILGNLRDRTLDLKRLRKQISEFQQQKSSFKRICTSRKSLSFRINDIRTASQKLHEALSNAWCCGDLRHGNDHFAKLCLDAKVQAGVSLDLTISCRENQHHINNASLSEPPIWLYVQSVSIDTMSCSTPPNENTARLKEVLSQHTEISSVSPKLKNKASLDLEQTLERNQKRKKRVRFRNISPEAELVIYAPRPVECSHTIAQPIIQQTSIDINLCQTKNWCHYLKQHSRLCGESKDQHYVGYLESPQMYKHKFYLQKRESSLAETSIKRQTTPQHTSIISVLDLIKQGNDITLTVVDQLKLAHKISLAILQFNATPWLIQRWRLKDFSYFSHDGSFDEDAFRTLHLSSQISPAALPDISAMEGVEEISGASEEDLYGINNTPLFFLGVALLELAHLKPLESLSTPQDLNEILTARRLAFRPTPLGSPKYQDIIRKCLQCNFGFGTDINKKELQTAVYEDVVCQLEAMIDKLTI